MLKNNHKGRYNNDYSPRYSDPYDIYDKAKEHIKNLRNANRNSNHNQHIKDNDLEGTK